METQQNPDFFDQRQCEMQRQAFQLQNPKQFEKDEKNSSCSYLWRNLEKVGTLLLLVYLVVVILNLIICKDNYLALNIPIFSQNGGRQNHGNKQNGQKSLITNEKILSDILKDESSFDQKSLENQDLTESYRSQKPAQNQPPNILVKEATKQDFSNKDQKKEVNIETSHQHIEASLLKKPEDFSVFISELNQEKEAEKNAKSKQKIEAIYKQLDEYPHHPIHSLSFEQLKTIINNYTNNPDSLLLSLVSQNSIFNLTRSKEDISYQDHIKKEHLANNYPTQQLCVIVSAQNNAYNSQILRTLNSIYNQHYKPYDVVIAQRNSNDKTPALIANYLKQNAAVASKTTYLQIDSDSEPFALLTAARSCKQNSLGLYLDGNTQFLGKQVFKIVNNYFSESKANIVYGNHYTLDVAKKKINLFNTMEYDESEQFMLAYRKIPVKYGKILAFKPNALLHIQQTFIKFNDKYFEYSGIDSLAVSLLEMSCGHIKSINEPLGIALIDSDLEKLEQMKRKNDLRHISQKLKIDIC